jgi:xanthine dehydrogenase YagR molybdenum-binding subunit
MTIDVIGQPVSRVDGRQKVTGGATYAAEFGVPNVAHAAVVRSTVANWRIISIDTAEAERAAGVLAVLTHRNAPRLAYRPHKGLPDAAVGERLHVLQDDRVNHQGQPIALVVADTLEQANHAAALVRAAYAAETGTTDVTRVEPVLPTQQKTDQGETPPAETRRGDPEGALAAAEVKVDHTYVIPRENHNPIEMHATIAGWDGDRLTLWDKTQWVHNVADEIAAVFGIPAPMVKARTRRKSYRRSVVPTRSTVAIRPSASGTRSSETSVVRCARKYRNWQLSNRFCSSGGIVSINSTRSSFSMRSTVRLM